jgi:acyl-coenzyme A synthetase/AMP-(fatty) acid ligase
MAFPLLAHGELEAPAASRGQGPVSAGRLLGEVEALAAHLPDQPYLINLCRDRYRFTVAFLAALRRGQVSLLPPSTIPAVIAQILEDYPEAHGLTDQPECEIAPQIRSYPQDLRPHAVDAVPFVAASQTAAILFTSGSTGRPKPCVKSWGGLAAGSRASGRRLGAGAFPGAHVIATVPAQHAFGLESSVMLPLQLGLVLQAERPFYPADVLAALARAPRPRILVTTPTHLRALTADAPLVPPADLIICATAPLAPQLAAKAEAAFGCPLMEIYGCSEAGQIASRRTVAGAGWRCLPGITLREEAGQMVASGGSVDMAAQLQDVIELEGPERFYLHGRNADLVNIAGKRSSLSFLNFHLNSIEGVADGFFIMRGEEGDAQNRPMAFVVAPGMTVEAVMAALRQRIDPAFLPRPLCLVDALPRNEVGKLPRAEIERLMAGAHGR